jgi:hypothetical protein
MGVFAERLGGTNMTKDDIIRMAREAGFRAGSIALSNGDSMQFMAPISATDCMAELERFAGLIAAEMKKRADQEAAMQEHVFADRMEAAITAEREACAKLCEEARASIWEYHPDEVKQAAKSVCANLATKIRAKGVT